MIRLLRCLLHALRGRSQRDGRCGGPDAVDRRVCCAVDLGHWLVQGTGQPDLHLELRCGRAAQHRAEGAGGGRQADTRGCRLRLHLSVLHRQRRADRRHHLRLYDGLFTGTDDQSLRRDDTGSQLFTEHDLGDARHLHAHPIFWHRRDARARLRRSPECTIRSLAPCSDGWGLP